MSRAFSDVPGLRSQFALRMNRVSAPPASGGASAAVGEADRARRLKEKNAALLAEMKDLRAPIAELEANLGINLDDLNARWENILNAGTALAERVARLEGSSAGAGAGAGAAAADDDWELVEKPVGGGDSWEDLAAGSAAANAQIGRDVAKKQQSLLGRQRAAVGGGGSGAAAAEEKKGPAPKAFPMSVKSPIGGFRQLAYARILQKGRHDYMRRAAGEAKKAAALAKLAEAKESAEETTVASSKKPTDGTAVTVSMDTLLEVSGAPKPTLAADSDSDSDDDDMDFDALESAEADGGAAELIAKKKKEAADAAAAKKKNKKVAKSSVILNVKPFEAETDMDALEKAVRGIQKDGLEWGGSELHPVAFGVKMLRIICVVEDENVSVDWLEETIQELEDCQSTEIFAFNKI